jgi:hypothetical protein
MSCLLLGMVLSLLLLLLLLLPLHNKEVNIKKLCDTKVKNADHQNHLCSIPTDSVSYLWWTKRRWNRFLSKDFCFLPVSVIPLLLHTHSFIYLTHNTFYLSVSAWEGRHRKIYVTFRRIWKQ